MSITSAQELWERFACRGGGYICDVLLMRPPGVYRVADDTALLAEVVRRGSWAHRRRVLDLGCGTGALALEAARAGAASVTAVDLSVRSIATTWLNARARRAPVQVRRGDLFEPVRGESYDLVLANPPYVPARTTTVPRHRMARCWDAGTDGRLLLDRVCTGVADALAPGGTALIVHSEVCDEASTLARLEQSGLRASVVARASVPLGPVMRARLDLLAQRGLWSAGRHDEEILVVEAHRD